MFTLTCQSYPHNAPIPAQYAHGGVPGGQNISPGFFWEDAPVNTKSFALSIIDPHPVAKNWVHWLIVDIPFRERKLQEGASRSHTLPTGCMEFKNSYNEMGYGGPEPPRGSGVHPYVATIYALNIAQLKMKADTSLPEFLRGIEGKVIAEATMTGTFEQR